MEALAFKTKQLVTALRPVATLRAQPRKISWREFQNRYQSREGRYKYEWVNGVAERTLYTMNAQQLYIQKNLTALFRHFLIEKMVVGELLAEPDLLLFEGHMRRPDMAWLTNEQIENLANEGAIEVPAFVIEVISNSDAASKVAKKMVDYRAAGVQVVWHIYPNLQEVHVYSGEKLGQMTVCTGSKICSAAPALPKFEATVDAVFYRKSADLI